MMVQLLNQPSQDQRIIQAERTWEQFKLIQQGFENSPGIRLFYYDGTLEILTALARPSQFLTCRLK
jgi:hypothetical protein